MLSGTIAFLCGNLLALRVPFAPTAWVLLAVPALAALAVARPRLRLIALGCAGLLFTLGRAALVLEPSLPPVLEGKDVSVTGTIASIPEQDPRRVRFVLQVQSMEQGGRAWPAPERVRLSWYTPAAEPEPGERWRLIVRMKRPRGFSNPGGFDYEAWLLQRRIRATGYVRAATRLDAARGQALARVRRHLDRALVSALDAHPQAGPVRALALGLRQGMGEQHWQVLRATGTSHLLAISGLHVGLVSAGMLLLARRLWSLSPALALRVPATRAAAVPALAAAAAYAALAGFSIPTQRALVMVAAFMASLVLSRRPDPVLGLCLALIAVLLLDPLASLSAGFWLSFGAVSFILLGMQGRLGAQGPWWRWGRVHVLVAVALLPLSLAFFGQSPWLTPLANLLAVPWVAMVVVPLVLAGTACVLPLPALGTVLLGLGAGALDLLWRWLTALSDLDLVYQAGLPAGGWQLASALAGVVILLLPRGFPGRWTGALWLTPLFWAPAPQPGPGEAWLSMLDVGQGLSVVVRTREHVLVYDTGPRYSASFDAGDAVLSPFLRRQGSARVDLLVISHADTDHAGGTRSLLDQLPVARILSSAPGEHPGAEACVAGERWRWDGVRFELIYPPEAGAAGGNEGSCVLRIQAQGASVLLAGDVEAGAEAALLERSRQALAATVLVAPHHGSRTSSTPAFVAAVAPRHVLFATGYRNRFGFPHPDVVGRYLRIGARLHESASAGAVTVALGAGGVAEIRHHRREAARFWHTPMAP